MTIRRRPAGALLFVGPRRGKDRVASSFARTTSATNKRISAGHERVHVRAGGAAHARTRRPRAQPRRASSRGAAPHHRCSWCPGRDRKAHPEVFDLFRPSRDGEDGLERAPRAFAAPSCFMTSNLGVTDRHSVGSATLPGDSCARARATSARDVELASITCSSAGTSRARTMARIVDLELKARGTRRPRERGVGWTSRRTRATGSQNGLTPDARARPAQAPSSGARDDAAGRTSSLPRRR